jgi:hypothetical protein
LERVPVQERIRRLLADQSYAVLCTQGQFQPYGSLVAFAASEDLKTIVFSTPIATRKYRLLLECNCVAMVVDNRSEASHNLMRIEAVTGTGQSRILRRGSDFDCWADLLIDRHPRLADFVHAETCALVCVDMVRYFYVGRFQEVAQWATGTIESPP